MWSRREQKAWTLEKIKESAEPGLLVLVVFLFGSGSWFTNMFENQSDRLTWSEFQTLVTGDNVDSISVIQNKNVPTGHVEIKLKKKDKDGKQVRYLYVSDINEVQDYLKENKLDYDMADVPQDTLFSTTILPVLLTLAGVMFIFIDEPSGRKCRKQSHELWKEPCKVKHRQRQEGYI